MDSGNSSSMQSSSGGDEEYDSRAEPTSAFVNPYGNLSSLSSHQPSLPSPPIDPLLLYLDAFARSLTPPSNTPPLCDLDASSCTAPAAAAINLQPPLPPTLSPAEAKSQRSTSAPLLAAGSRSSKKRPRTTRRELTTVLTTDTSNFRAMVQEFTGLPALPFSSSFTRSALPVASPFSLFKPFAISSSSSSTSSNLPNFLVPPPMSSVLSAPNVSSSTDKMFAPESNTALNSAHLLNVLNLQSYLHSSPSTGFGSLDLTLPVLGAARTLAGTAAMGSLTTAANFSQPVEITQSTAGGGAEGDLLRWIGGSRGLNEQRADKGSDSVPISGEGTVSSWIRSSTERRS